MEKTTECPLTDIDPVLRQMVEDILQEGEEILICYRVEYHMIWVQVITNIRVISAKAIALRVNIFSKPKIEMPRISMLALEDIVHYGLARSEDYDLHCVRITASDGRTLETNFTLESAAQKFFRVLQSAILSGSKQNPQEDAADRLRKLSELLDMKLISDEEYRVKRSQILKDL
jgi:hypothetical protein